LRALPEPKLVGLQNRCTTAVLCRRHLRPVGRFMPLAEQPFRQRAAL